MPVRCAFSLSLVAAIVLVVIGLGSAQPRAAQLALPQATGPLATAPDQQFTSDGVSLRYRDAGSGDAVVFIHGYSATLDTLLPLAGALGTSHRLVAMDVRGFGRSSKFAEPARFGQQMVDDVVKLLDHLKIQRAHLVGHSMGALIAANVASRYPNRVLSASLIAGPFYATKPVFTKEVSPWVADLESGKGLTNFIKWLFPAMDATMLANMSGMILKVNDVPSLTAVMRSLPELAIAGLRAPGLRSVVAAGTVDPLHPLSPAFVKASTGAKLLEIPGADHITIVMNPEVVKAVRELIGVPVTASGGMREAA